MNLSKVLAPRNWVANALTSPALQRYLVRMPLVHTVRLAGMLNDPTAIALGNEVGAMVEQELGDLDAEGKLCEGTYDGQFAAVYCSGHWLFDTSPHGDLPPGLYALLSIRHFANMRRHPDAIFFIVVRWDEEQQMWRGPAETGYVDEPRTHKQPKVDHKAPGSLPGVRSRPGPDDSIDEWHAYIPDIQEVMKASYH